MAVTLHQLLKTLVEQGGTDLHITTNSPPQIRIDGKLVPLQLPAADGARDEAARLLHAHRRAEAPVRGEPGAGLLLRRQGARAVPRQRLQPARRRGGRLPAIPWEIKGFKELGLPDVVEKLCEKPRGLVLVTGPTGSGKSTTLAAMIDKVNSERHEHIVTIEDPIEYLHTHKQLHRQPARAARRHPLLPERPAVRPAPGPGRRAHRRDARPGDHRVGPADRRDGPPDLRHPAHELGRADHQPHHRRLPRAPAVADPRPALLRAGGDPLPEPSAQGQRQGARAWPWRS